MIEWDGNRSRTERQAEITSTGIEELYRAHSCYTMYNLESVERKSQPEQTLFWLTRISMLITR